MDKWLEKVCIYIYIHNGVLFSYKKEGNPTMCSSMDGPWGHYIKWNKSARERRILYDLTNMWYLKQNKPKYEQTNWVHGYREQIAGYQRGGGEVGGSVESGWRGWRGLKSGNPQL